MSTAAPMAIPPTGPAAAGSHPERANSLSAAAPATSSSSYRQVGAGSGLSPAPSSLFSSASPMTPSPILASALSLPGGRSTGTFAFNPFFSTSPKTFAGAGPLASSPSSAATYGAHQRSFSIAGGAGDGKPILVSGFPGGSAVADDDDDEPSPPASTRASLGGGGHPPFGLPPLRRPSQPVKLPAQLQSQIKPPSASLGASNAPAASSAPTASGKPTPALQTMNAPVGSTADNGGGGSQAGAGRGHGVLRRLSLGAGSLLSRPNLGPSPPQPVDPKPTVATATALPPAADFSGPGAAGRAGRPTGRKGSGGTTGTGAAGGAPAKKRGISPTGERILQGHF